MLDYRSVETGRVKAVQPPLALLDVGSKPHNVAIDARLRTKALEAATVSYKPELAVAVGAMILHDVLPIH